MRKLTASALRVAAGGVFWNCRNIPAIKEVIAQPCNRGKARKAVGGMGNRQAGGIKGGGKRNTHVGDKKSSPGGLTSD